MDTHNGKLEVNEILHFLHYNHELTLYFKLSNKISKKREDRGDTIVMQH